MNDAQMKIVPIILRAFIQTSECGDNAPCLTLTRLVKQRAICSVSARFTHRVGYRDHPRWLVKLLAAQADEAAATINLPLQSRCERRL